jgi:hypothetical protein
MFGSTAVVERDQEMSDYHGEDDSVDFDGGNSSIAGVTSNIGVTKNLRTRKNINYNEDKMLQNADSVSLTG